MNQTKEGYVQRVDRLKLTSKSTSSPVAVTCGILASFHSSFHLLLETQEH